jgi:hypothetical protein
VKGNFHARFLGGCERATAHTYPVLLSSSVVVGIRTLAGFGDRRGMMMQSLSIARGDMKLLGLGDHKR